MSRRHCSTRRMSRSIGFSHRIALPARAACGDQIDMRVGGGGDHHRVHRRIGERGGDAGRHLRAVRLGHLARRGGVHVIDAVQRRARIGGDVGRVHGADASGAEQGESDHRAPSRSHFDGILHGPRLRAKWRGGDEHGGGDDQARRGADRVEQQRPAGTRRRHVAGDLPRREPRRRLLGHRDRGEIPDGRQGARPDPAAAPSGAGLRLVLRPAAGTVGRRGAGAHRRPACHLRRTRRAGAGLCRDHRQRAGAAGPGRQPPPPPVGRGVQGAGREDDAACAAHAGARRADGLSSPHGDGGGDRCRDRRADGGDRRGGRAAGRYRACLLRRRRLARHHRAPRKPCRACPLQGHPPRRAEAGAGAPT